MELLVLHSAGASEEQDRLHRAWELRGADDKGTHPLRAATPGKYLGTVGSPKKNSFEKELLQNI